MHASRQAQIGGRVSKAAGLVHQDRAIQDLRCPQCNEQCIVRRLTMGGAGLWGVYKEGLRRNEYMKHQC